MIDNKNYSDLITLYRAQCKVVCNSSSLEELLENYVVADTTLQTIVDYIENNFTDPEVVEREIRTLDAATVHIWIQSGGIPNWDSSFNAQENYDAYENYFQRYGCFGVDCIVSWDARNIIITDGQSTQMVIRPDVLMNAVN